MDETQTPDTAAPAGTESDSGSAQSALEPHLAANAEQIAAIDKIVSEFAAAVEAEDESTAPEETTPPQEATADSTEVVAAGEDPTPPAPDKDSTEDRSLSRLVEREVEIRRREDAVKSRESEVTALHQELSELREKSKGYTGDFQAQLRLKPTEALRAAGHDPEHLVRLILAEKMVTEGKPVPAELRAAIKEAELDYRYSNLEKRQEEYQRQQAAQKWIADIESGARTYLSGDFSKHAPTVAAVAKANPDAVYRAIMDEIAADANDRAGKDQAITVLPYEEAVRRAERRFQALRSLFVSDPPPAAGMAPSGAPTTTPGMKVESQKSSPTTPRPPAKPLVAKKPLSATELEAEGIKAAMAEFKRVEAAKKAVTTS